MNKEFAKGLAKVKENDFNSAILHFNTAIEEDSNQVEYYAERAVAYLNIEKFDLSMFDMNKCIELEPKNSYRYSCRAFLKAKIGDGEGAILDYQKAIELDPKDSIAYNNMGLVQEQLGYQKESQKSFEKSNNIIGYNPKRFDEGELKTEAPTETIEEEPSISKKEVVKDVFTKRSAFKEFLSFIGNGFKLKENDESGEK